MAKTISESGMNCIADNSFHIEKSDCYARLGGKVKTVEYIRAKDNGLMFVEAKSSCPNPNNPQSVGDVANYVEDICDKFIHSLNLYASIAVGVHEQAMLDFEPAEKVTLKFVLIIKKAEPEWCIPIKKAITNRLRETDCIANIWKPEIYAMNKETAIRRQLVMPDAIGS